MSGDEGKRRAGSNAREGRKKVSAAWMGRFRILQHSSLAFAAAAIAAVLLALGEARGHPVEQLFATLEEEGGRWTVEVLFDAAFALPEYRENTDEPPPERSWLLERTPREHERIREGADAYLKERLRFFLGDAPLSWEAGFPDYEKSPPDFPKLLNGGAYLRVRLQGQLDPRGGALALEMSGGPGPTIVVAIGAQGEPRYVSVTPQQRAVLFEVPARGDVGREGIRAIWIGLLATGCLLLATIWKLSGARSQKLEARS